MLVAGEAGIGKTRLASELARRARDAGFEVLLGRSIDLVGTELPYQPFVEALRPLGAAVARRAARARSCGCSRRRSRSLTERAAAAPVLLVLEDLHWADTSTLDLVVFLAHNLDDRPVLLLATYRADERSSAERMRRLADGVRRSGAALVLELGPLAHEELTALLAARADAPPPAALTDAIVARSEGNPFFAEELLAAAGDEGGELPRGLRELLLQRVAGLDRATQSLLRLAAAAGRDVGYPLLRAVGGARRSPTCASRCAGRSSTASSSPTRRPAASASATRCWRRRSTRRSCPASARSCTRGSPTSSRAAPPRHRRSSRRTGRRRVATQRRWPRRSRRHARRRRSSAWRRRSRTSSARSRCGTPCRTRPSSWGSTSPSSAPGRPSWPAQTGAAPRAVELARRAIELVGESDPPRAALLHESLGRYLHASGRGDDCPRRVRARRRARAGAAALARARAGAGGARGGLMLAWRYDESLAICEQALALARAVGARRGGARALTVLGTRPRLPRPRRRGARAAPAGRAARRGARRPVGLQRAYVKLTDVLMMLGRPRESARLAQAALDAMRRVRDRSQPCSSPTGSRPSLAIGEWDEADTRQRRRAARHHRQLPAHAPHRRAATSRSAAATSTPRGRTSTRARATLRQDRGSAIYDALRRRARAVGAPLDGRRRGRARRSGADALPRHGPDPRLALRQGTARTGRAGGARTRPPRRRRRPRPPRSRADAARRRARRRRGGLSRSRRTPAAGERSPRPSTSAPAASPGPSCGPTPRDDAGSGSSARRSPPTAAGARPRRSSPPARPAPRRARRSARRMPSRPGSERGPSLRELELLARAGAARSDAAPTRRRRREAGPGGGPRADAARGGGADARRPRPTPTARSPRRSSSASRPPSVHVSHILRKLDAPNRLEAAAIAHRLAPD